MIRRMRGVMVVLAAASLALATACGGGGGASEEEADDTQQTAGGAEPVADPTDGGRRRAVQGAECDFGGAADRTCQRGLFCCYGPPDDPGEHGECMPECPEY